MILTCPSCTKRFLLDAALLGSGRRVKCGQCGHVWHQTPPAGSKPAKPSTPPPAPAARVQPRPRPEPPKAAEPPSLDFESIAFAADDRPPVAEAADESPLSRLRPKTATGGAKPVANLPAIPGTGPRRRTGLLKWGALAATAVALVAGTVAAREPILEVWPASFRLYEAVGLAEVPGAGLAIPGDKAKIEAREIEGNTLLFVSGEVVNTSPKQRAVPDLLATALGEDGTALFSWRIVPTTRRLFPNQSAPFESRFPERGGQAKTISFSFVEPEKGA